MGVDGSVSSRAGQVLVLSVGDVKVRLRVAVLLSETKVDDVDLVASFADAHEEIVGLDIAVDEVARMDVLDAGDLCGCIYSALTASMRRADAPADLPVRARP